MNANITYTKPINKSELINLLKTIRDYYIHHKDEFVKPNLLPLELYSRNMVIYSDEQLRERAKIILRAGQVTEIFNKKEEISVLIEKKKDAVFTLNLKKESAIESSNNFYLEKYDKYLSEARARGTEFSEKTSNNLSLILQEKQEKALEIEGKYDEQIALFNSEIDLLNENYNSVSEYFLEKHNAEIETKTFELKENQRLEDAEVQKYNNSIQEKEVKHANALVQAETKLAYEFMEITSKDPSVVDLARRGYFADIVSVIIEYYYEFDNPIDAYNEFSNESEFNVFLTDWSYRSGLDALYVRAFGPEE